MTDTRVFRIHEWLLATVREMELGSTHPIALALTRYCESQGIKTSTLLECEEKPGRGLIALVQVGSDTYPVLVGNGSLMRDHEVHVDESHVDEWQRQGKTTVYVAVGRPHTDSAGKSWSGYELAMSFGVADAPRPEAAETIAKLQGSDKEVWMLSGDNIVTAKAVAQNLGIPSERVVAGVLPHEKADFIVHLQAQPIVRSSLIPWLRREDHAVVAFCGDGLNDSAAIAAADIG